MLKLREQRPEHRWAEHDAGDQLAQNCGLANPLHYLAQQSAAEQQGDDLGYENRDRRTVRAGGGGKSRSRDQAQRNGNDKRQHGSTRKLAPSWGAIELLVEISG